MVNKMAVNIIKDILPETNRNRPQTIIEPKYITIHETGNRKVGANAKNHSAYLKSASAEALPVSWHFTVDDKEIYQHLPLNENGWHAGDGGKGTGNMQSIGIEICVNSDGDFIQAKKNAQYLVGRLLKQLNLPIESVVQHNRWTGKNCPENIRKTPNGWQNFLNGIDIVKEESEETEVMENRNNPSDWALEAVTWAKDNEIIFGDVNGNLGLDNSCTREQMMVFLHRLYSKFIKAT